jgi:hypothetical protein
MVEWLKVKVLSSSPSTTRERERNQTRREWSKIFKILSRNTHPPRILCTKLSFKYEGKTLFHKQKLNQQTCLEGKDVLQRKGQ